MGGLPVKAGMNLVLRVSSKGSKMLLISGMVRKKVSSFANQTMSQGSVGHMGLSVSNSG